VTVRPTAPAYVQFFPTLRCNLACGFCFNRALTPMPDVEPEDFALMLDRLQDAGVDAIDLLGGEPTLHPRLDELVNAIAARRMRTALSTNGHGDLALLERLEDRFGRVTLRVGVSVNGRETPGFLRDYIARRAPMVKSVCVRNWDLPPAAAEHLARADTEYYLIFRDALAARELGDSIAYPEYRSRLDALRARHPRAAGVACDGFVPDSAAGDQLRRVRCPAGTTKLAVLPDGSVYPCYLLFSRPEFRLGNLLTDGFAAIWSRPRLEFFRTFSENFCPRRECAYHSACHGGCPAVSLLIAGDLSAPDPRCVPPAVTLLPP
jgi:radical SAM protein with 4Fe4S-binding SPASM domain